MRGNIGDEIIVDAAHIGEPSRKGEIIEVLEKGGVEHYRVRWDDGHESLYFPGSGAHVAGEHGSR